jgi:hypothetical protein
MALRNDASIARWALRFERKLCASTEAWWPKRRPSTKTSRLWSPRPCGASHAPGRVQSSFSAVYRAHRSISAGQRCDGIARDDALGCSLLAVTKSVLGWAILTIASAALLVSSASIAATSQTDYFDSFDFLVVPVGESGTAVVRLSGRSDNPRAEPIVSEGALTLSPRACGGRYDVSFHVFSSASGDGRTFTGQLTVVRALLGSRKVRCPLARLRMPASRIRLSVRAVKPNRSCRVLRVLGQRGIGGRAGPTGTYAADIISTQNFFATKQYRLHLVLLRRNQRRTVTLTGALNLQDASGVGVTCLTET